MPVMYFDTSALVRRYVSEVGSLWARITLAQSSRNVVYTSALAQPEVLPHRGFRHPLHLLNPPWPPFVKGGNRGETMANNVPRFCTSMDLSQFLRRGIIHLVRVVMTPPTSRTVPRV